VVFSDSPGALRDIGNDRLFYCVHSFGRFLQKDARAFMLLAIMLLMAVFPSRDRTFGRRGPALAPHRRVPVPACGVRENWPVVFILRIISAEDRCGSKRGCPGVCPAAYPDRLVCGLTLLEPDLGRGVHRDDDFGHSLRLGLQLRYVFGALAVLLPALYF